LIFNEFEIDIFTGIVRNWFKNQDMRFW